MAILITSKQEGVSVLTGLIAAVLLAIGFFFLMKGLGIQWAVYGAWSWWSLLHYFIAIVLLGIGNHLCRRSSK